MNDILEELDARESFIKEIVKSGCRGQREIAQKVLSYHAKKREEKKAVRALVATRPPPKPRSKKSY